MSTLPRSRMLELTRRPAVRSLAGILVDYGVIAIVIAAVTRWPHPLLYVAAVVVIGTRQHSLLTLLHEGVHRQLASSRRLNDAVSEAILAWPFLLDLESYRRFHLAHHKFVNTERDPERQLKRDWPSEWRFPRSLGSLVRLSLGDLVGVHAGSFLSYMRRMNHIVGGERRPGHRVARAVAVATTVGVLVWTGTWLHALLFWVVPASTSLVCFARLREICEHAGVPATSPALGTRTVRASLWGRFLVAPRNVGFHLEHHLFPNVPWFRLPELHRELARGEEYRRDAHVVRGYGAALREVTF